MDKKIATIHCTTEQFYTEIHSVITVVTTIIYSENHTLSCDTDLLRQEDLTLSHMAPLL